MKAPLRPGKLRLLISGRAAAAGIDIGVAAAAGLGDKYKLLRPSTQQGASGSPMELASQSQ